MEPLGISSELLRQLSDPLISRGHTVQTYDSFTLDTQEMISRARDAEAIIIANHPLPRAVIEAAPRLQMISVAFVGVDHVDLAACAERGLKVSNTGGYCNDAVAELAVGLALDCLRNITVCHQAVQNGKGKAGLQGRELAGRTVGIVGTGAIGCRTAELFRAFGCKLLGCSRTQHQAAQDLGIEYLPLDELMRRADIVSIHTPLTPETRNLIGKAQIGLMKPGAILINTSRGPVVDTHALADALNAGKISAGIDVYESDPPLPPEHPLVGTANLVCTPHVGFDTRESIDRRAIMAFENVASWLDGKQIRTML